MGGPGAQARIRATRRGVLIRRDETRPGSAGRSRPPAAGAHSDSPPDQGERQLASPNTIPRFSRPSQATSAASVNTVTAVSDIATA